MKVAGTPRPWMAGAIRIFVLVSSLSSLVASVPVLSSVSSTSIVGIGFDKAPNSLPLLCTPQGAFLHCIPRRVGVDSDQRQRPVFIFTTVALLSIFRIRNISDSFSAWKMSEKIETGTIIPPERIIQQTSIFLVLCTILFSGCI